MTQTTTRRKPIQERSRGKVEAILAAARQLIGDRGTDAVSMREIAKHIGIAPSSIYQYFPDKNAILAAIIAEYYEGMNAVIKILLDNANTPQEIITAAEQAIDQLALLLKEEPMWATLSAAINASPELRELDTEDSRRNAQAFADRVCKIMPHVDTQQAYDASLIIIEMISVTGRMTLTMNDEEGKRLMTELKTLCALRVRSLIKEQ